MSDQIGYKCPACGGALAFDTASQKLKCPYCDSSYDTSQFQTMQEPPGVPKNPAGAQNRAQGNPGNQAQPGNQNGQPGAQSRQAGSAPGQQAQPGNPGNPPGGQGAPGKPAGAQAGAPNSQQQGNMDWNVEPGSEWNAGEQDRMYVLSCQSCGGEIVCEETTAAASCPYCGNPVVLKGKVSGMLKPDYVIPFKLNKQQAKEALTQHVRSKKMVPKLFKDENHIEEIKGVYIPFWLFDAEVEANFSFKGERTRSWSDSRYHYTEHNYYRIQRAGHVTFDHVPVDGSKKMPDDLMESIEPFDFKEAVPFDSAYLAGFLADKYDVDAQASMKAANARIRKSTEDMFEATVEGFTGVTKEHAGVQLQNGVAKYALYPVWLLNTKWKDQMYTFAMNGQTGKFVGDLPLDGKAFFRRFALFSGIFSVVGIFVAAFIDAIF